MEAAPEKDTPVKTANESIAENAFAFKFLIYFFLRNGIYVQYIDFIDIFYKKFRFMLL